RRTRRYIPPPGKPLPARRCEAGRPDQAVDLEALTAGDQRSLAMAPELEVFAAVVVDSFEPERGERCPDRVARVAAAALGGLIAAAAHADEAGPVGLLATDLRPAQRSAAVGPAGHLRRDWQQTGARHATPREQRDQLGSRINRGLVDRPVGPRAHLDAGGPL